MVVKLLIDSGANIHALYNASLYSACIFALYNDAFIVVKMDL